MEELLIGTVVWRDGLTLTERQFQQGETQLADGFALKLEAISQADRLTIRVLLSAEKPVQLEALFVQLAQPVIDTDKIFLNGYQTWTESRMYRPDEKIQALQAPFERLIHTTGDYTFYKNPHQHGSLHAWSFTSLVAADGHSIFFMDTAPASGYQLFEWRCKEGHLILRKDVGGRMLEGDALMMQVEIWGESGTEITWLDLENFQARPVKAPVSGWTSWYNYYTKIDEQIIMDNLRAFGQRDIPIDFFQIDDGWQPAVGDWTTANSKFPLGMGYLADQIHRYGYKAGLWLAPLIVEKASTIYQEHSDWLLSHDGERLVEAGFNPGWGGMMAGTYYVLNLDLPEVQAHLRQVFDHVLNIWGYDLVKLDFLFAAALVPSGGKSRGQRMQEAFAFLRSCCGDKLLLGCGVPLAAAWGMADYCRIGPDIGLSWELGIAKTIHLRERISTHNALHNTINRRHFSGRFFANDPDVFILRKNNNDLSPLQQHTLLIINHIFGDLLFTSDDIGGYSDATMRLYRSTFPLLPRHIERVEVDGERYKIWFEIAGRHYFAAANLQRVDLKIGLPEETMYRNGEGFVEESQAVYLKPYETRVYLAAPKSDFGILGSDLHIFPGSEVAEMSMDSQGKIQIALHAQVVLSGTLVLRVPNKGDSAWVNGQQHAIRRRGDMAMVILAVVDGKFA